MQQGPPVPTPQEQVTYLTNLVSKAEKMEMLTASEADGLMNKVDDAQDALNIIAEQMKRVQTLYAETYPEVMQAIHEGAKRKNGRGDGS